MEKFLKTPILKNIRVKIFKKEPNKIYGKQLLKYLKSYLIGEKKVGEIFSHF